MSASVSRAHEPILVIGVGSELRRDDAAGRLVATAIELRALPGVEVASLHQLAPEQAMEIAGRRLVIIVDASVDVREVTVEQIVSQDTAEDTVGSMSHHLDIGAVVRLAGMLASAPHEVLTVSVPAHDLSLGSGLSDAAQQAVEAATEIVAQLCERATEAGSHSPSR